MWTVFIFGFVLVSGNHRIETYQSKAITVTVLRASAETIVTNLILLPTVLRAIEVMKKDDMIRTEEKVVLERGGALFGTGSFLPVVR
jgi:hypothetical protein